MDLILEMAQINIFYEMMALKHMKFSTVHLVRRRTSNPSILEC